MRTLQKVTDLAVRVPKTDRNWWVYLVAASTYFSYDPTTEIENLMNCNEQTSPEDITLNQIDHLLNTKRWLSSIKDVRSYRGTNCQSGHYMVKIVYSARRRRNDSFHDECKEATDKKNEAYSQHIELNIRTKRENYGNLRRAVNKI